MTKRQHQVLEFVRGYIQQHTFAPSYEEIAKGLGLSSLATVSKHLWALREQGLVTWRWNCARSLAVHDVCPACRRPFASAEESTATPDAAEAKV